MVTVHLCLQSIFYMLQLSSKLFKRPCSRPVALYASRMPVSERKVLLDSDGAFDDVVAIQCALAHGRDIDLVTTVCGSSTASTTAQGLQRLFPHLNIVAGPNRPRPAQDWLPRFRQRFSDFVNLHGVPTTNEADPLPEDTFLDRVREFLDASPDGSVDLICLGPLSNVADWYRSFPSLLTTKVAQIWILGGAHPEKERPDEFNFGQDPAAASLVLEKMSDRIHLVPGDATSHHQVSESYIKAILERVHSTSSTNLLAQVAKEEQHYALFYDPVCIFLYLTPHGAQFPHVPLRVCPKSGVTQTAKESLLPVAKEVDFDAYQLWLYKAIQQSEPVVGTDP